LLAQEVNLGAASLTGSAGTIQDAAGIAGLTMSISGSSSLSSFAGLWLGVDSGEAGFPGPWLVNLGSDEWISFSFDQDVLLLGIRAENVNTVGLVLPGLARGEVAQVDSPVFSLLGQGDIDGFGAAVSGSLVTWQNALAGDGTVSFPGGVYLPANTPVTFSEAASVPGAPLPSNGIGLGSVAVAPVPLIPEPGGLELFALGLGGILILRRRRR
jgi:hypothetical protein